MIFLPHQKSILPQWITNLMGDSDESYPILWWVGTECTWNRHLLFKMNLNHDANKSLFNFIFEWCCRDTAVQSLIYTDNQYKTGDPTFSTSTDHTVLSTFPTILKRFDFHGEISVAKMVWSFRWRKWDLPPE